MTKIKQSNGSIRQKNYLLNLLSQRTARKLNKPRHTSGFIHYKVDLSQNVFINFIENKRVSL
jgi:hypothetical protein